MRQRNLIGWLLSQDVDLGYVPSGDADHGGGALQVGGVPGHGQRLRLAGEQRDVVVLPDRGLQLVVAGQLLAGRRAAPHVGPEQERDGGRRVVGDRDGGGAVRAVGPGLGRGRSGGRDGGGGQRLQRLQAGVLAQRAVRLAQ